MRLDLVDLLLALREGQLSVQEAHWSPNPAVCVVLTSRGYPGKPETGHVITGIESAESLGGVKVFVAGAEVRDRKLVTSGGRVLGVTATAEDLPSAIERVYAAVDKIKFEGMHFRRDIGAKGLRHISVTTEEVRPPRPGPALRGPAKL
jgi:phosphoribosylamine--glycine ligase